VGYLGNRRFQAEMPGYYFVVGDPWLVAALCFTCPIPEASIVFRYMTDHRFANAASDSP